MSASSRPNPTWPIRTSAFDSAPRYTARRLLRRIEEHVDWCLSERTIVELESLDELGGGRAAGALATESSRAVIALAGQADLARLDAQFEQLRAEADVSAAFDPKAGDVVVPGLLAAGLDAWIRERGDDGLEFTQDPPPGRKPALHACLMLTVDERTERQHKWAFRAISADNAKAFLNRLRTAVSRGGLDEGDPGKQLFVPRRACTTGSPETRPLSSLGC